jgi:hypothetical protein
MKQILRRFINIFLEMFVLLFKVLIVVKIDETCTFKLAGSLTRGLYDYNMLLS